jgi:hypothetical protein
MGMWKNARGKKGAGEFSNWCCYVKPNKTWAWYWGFRVLIDFGMDFYWQKFVEFCPQIYDCMQNSWEKSGSNSPDFRKKTPNRHFLNDKVWEYSQE